MRSEQQIKYRKALSGLLNAGFVAYGRQLFAVITLTVIGWVLLNYHSQDLALAVRNEDAKTSYVTAVTTFLVWSFLITAVSCALASGRAIDTNTQRRPWPVSVQRGGCGKHRSCGPPSAPIVQSKWFGQSGPVTRT